MTDMAAPQDAAQLQRALVESRQRWQDFGRMAADILFETDADGRFTFVSPDSVLGWRAGDLLGRPAAELLESSSSLAGLFGGGEVRQRKLWVKRGDGAEACVCLTIAPRLDGQGRRAGLRGTGLDVTVPERQSMQMATSLRRSEVLDHILDQIRQEVLAPQMVLATMETLLRALGGTGAAVLDLALQDGAAVMHQAGHDPARMLPELLARLHVDDTVPQSLQLAGGTQVLACQASTRFGHHAALLVWREGSGRCWDNEDKLLISSAAGVIRIVLEHEAIQRELARQARTDPLTGLLNRRAFMDEAGRRIERLERECAPGTLLFLDLDRLKPLNDRLGHDAGDAALLLTGNLLRRHVRPADLVARLGGDEFALWLDGSDELTAAERAETLRLSVADELAHLTVGQDFGMTASIGIACRHPGTNEELDQLIQRADAAMYKVKRTGRGHWQVSQPERVR